MRKVFTCCAVAALAGSATAEVVNVHLDIDESASSYEAIAGLGIFQPQPVFAVQLTTAIRGYVDVELNYVGDSLTSIRLAGGHLIADALIELEAEYNGAIATASLTDASVIVLDSTAAATSPAGGNDFSFFLQDISYGFTGILNVDLFGFILDPIDLSEQTASDPFGQFGTVTVDGDSVEFNSGIFFQGGDFGDQILDDPDAPNAAYSGSGNLVARGRIPAPGVVGTVGLGALIAFRRRR